MKRRLGFAFRWLLLSATGAVVVGAVGLLVFRIARPLVTVTQAVEGPVVEAFYATGTLQPDREYPIRSNVAGILDKVEVDKGDAVHRGQELAMVISDDLQFKLAQAKADLAEKTARANEKNSPVVREFDQRLGAFNELVGIDQREVDRLQNLVAKNAASQDELDHALDRLKNEQSDMAAEAQERATMLLQLQRELAVAQAAYDIAKWNCDQAILRSPIDGVVLDWPTPRGTRVAVNDHVMQVADISARKLVMRAQVDEEDKAKCQQGQVVKMTLYSFPDRVFTGHVERIYDQADPDRRTFEVDVAMQDPDAQFAAGMTGELNFIISAKDKAMIVPAQALQDGDLWVVRDGRLQRSGAIIGIRGIERVEVLSGLRPGDQVVISPVGTLNAGQFVRIESMDPLAAAGLNKPKTAPAAFNGFKG